MLHDWGFRQGARGVAVRGTASRAGRRPKAPVHKIGEAAFGRAGEPARGAPAASGSLADVPHRPRLPSCPADRPRDLYGSFLWIIGIRPVSDIAAPWLAGADMAGTQLALFRQEVPNASVLD